MAGSRPRQYLTDQERVFCRAFVRLGSCVGAAREADYPAPETYGFKLVKRKLIAVEIERLRAQVNASRDPVLVADAIEVRSKLTWLMRFAVSEEVQLKSAVALARLIGMTGEFGLRMPAGEGEAAALPATVVDTKGYAQKSTAELKEEGKVIALKLLKSGNDG